MSFPPDLLDELARVYAHAAVEAFLAATKAANMEDSQSENSDSTLADGGQVAQDAPG